MTTDKVSGKSAQLRSLLIKAWRERWSPSQYGTQVKSLLGRGVSGDVYGLADCLLSQALTGPAPNQLLLSLLSHSLATQLVSHSATLQSVARFSSFSRPHCTAVLLQMLLSQRSYITCRSPKGEECIQLSCSLLALATWLLTTATQTVARLVELRDSSVDSSNLTNCLAVLQWLARDKFTSCLIYTGRLEDQELAQELLTAAKLASKSCDQLYTFLPEGSTVEQDLRLAVDEMRSLDPTSRLVTVDKSHLSYTLHSLLSFDSVLCPTSDLSQLAGHLSTILSLKGISLSNLLSELIRCCLLAMNEHDGFEVLKWDAFTLIKLPRLVSQLLQLSRGHEDVVGGRSIVHLGLVELLDHTTLLDMTDARCKANSFELVVKSLKSLLTDSETEQLLTSRHTQLEPRKLIDLKPPPDSRDVNLIIKADSTLATIIQTFENRTTEQSEFENLLSVMFHIIKGSSFDLLLSASAANGTLTALVSKLLMFNDGCKESQGESVKVSQNRAALFDMTFLMLVYMVQCFGSSVVLKGTHPCFFSQWARQCMVEPGSVKPLANFCSQESLVDSLLQQFTQGEVRTQVVKWHNVCSSVHSVMSELLLGAELGAVGKDLFVRLSQQLYSKLCCFPVCIVSWLASYTHYGEGSRGGGEGGWRKERVKGVSPLEVVDKFLDITPDVEDGENLPYFQERSKMMVNIVKKMRLELVRGGIVERETSGWSSSNRVGDSVALEEDVVALWEDTWRRGRLDIAGTKQVARLFATGGPEWFVMVLVERMVSQVYWNDIDRATEMVFSLLHIDLVACSLALLVHVLPRCLAGKGQENILSHPGGRALARLTVQCVGAVLAMKSSRPYNSSDKSRGSELVELCNGVQQPVKLRKLNGGESAPQETQEQLVEQAHVGLFHMVTSLGQEPLLCPRLEFVSTLLEEAVLTGRDQARAILAPLTPSLVMQLVKLQPDRFSLELIIRLFDTTSSLGRRNTSKIICLIRNTRALKEGNMPEC